jgi:Fe2+ or Zn2+ uptake regulation protein
MTDERIMGLLKQNGLRPTYQRVMVLRYLLEHPCHPPAEEIYEALKHTCSLMTVYNALDALVDAGLARLVTIEAGVKRFDATVEDHGHFRCKKCEKVFDFPMTDANITVTNLDGFLIQYHDLYCSGICPDCAK